MSGDAASREGVLRGLTARTVSLDSVEAIAAALVQAIDATLEFDQIHLSQVSQDAAVARARVLEPGRPVPPDDSQYTQVFDDRPSGVAHVVATRETLHVPDARGSGEIRADLAERFDVGSMLFVPLIWQQTVHHVVILIRHARSPFAPAEIELVETIAGIGALALALEDCRRTRAAQRARDAALASAAQLLNAGSDLQTVLEGLAEQADNAVGGDLAGFYLGDVERGGVATAGHNAPEGWHGLVMAPGEGVAGQVLVGGSPVITNAYQSDVRVPRLPGLQHLQTAVSVPLRSGDRVVGALSVGFRRMRRIADEDLRTLQAIADLAAVACRRAG